MQAVNQYYRALTRGAISPVYDLSSESGWIHCFSLAKRFSSYSGPCITVVRDSDLATLDIYFDSDDLVDLSAINAFCAGTTGRVDIFYDQYGSGNNLIGIGAKPTIYASGSSGYKIDTNGNSGFEFTSDFNVLRNFSYIQNSNNLASSTPAFLVKRGYSNRGVVVGVAGPTKLNLTYFGVLGYESPGANSGHQSLSSLKYLCWFHSYNFAFSSSSYVAGIGSFTDLGTISIGTMLTTTSPTRIAVSVSSAGAITGYADTSIRELFFFSIDQRNNTNIFDKKLTL